MSKELKITEENVLKAMGSCEGFKKIAEILWPDIFESEITFRVGDKFFNDIYGDESILANVNDREVCLIGLGDGNRYRNPVTVKKLAAISVCEFLEISGGVFTQRRRGI